MAGAIEFDDAGLAVAADGELLASSPGYALVGRDEIVVGQAARAEARLEPLAVQNRFWSELAQEPLRQRLADSRSNADLAYAHLAPLARLLRGRADTVIGAVPPSLNENQLALILGIARACELPLAGFVDSALGVAGALPHDGHFLHIGFQLHDAVVTAIEIGAELRRGRVEIVRGAGVLALQDRWLALVARRFITDTRFDPLHEAGNEQALFDALPDWLGRLQGESFLDVEMSFGEDTHRIRLTREELALEAEPILDTIVAQVRRLRRAGEPATLGMSETVASFPGLMERLAEFSECEVVAFPAGAAALALSVHSFTWGAIGESVTLLRTLPRSPEVPERVSSRVLRAAQAIAPAAAPTHVLYRGHAHPLRRDPLVIGLDPGAGPQRLQVAGARAGISRQHCSVQLTPHGAILIDHSRFGTWINDEYVSGRAPLRAGDRVRVGTPGVTLDFIALA